MSRDHFSPIGYGTPMTDIVERLREGAGHVPEDVMEAERAMSEAADEIERLRANEAAAIFAFRETNDIALEEIKRLRAEMKSMQAEIRRLVELFRIDGEQHAQHVKTILRDQDTRLAAYKADNERLRAALQAVMDEWRDGYGLNCVDQVRRALEPKP